MLRNRTSFFLILIVHVAVLATLWNSMDKTAIGKDSENMPALKPGVDHQMARWRAVNYSDVHYSLDVKVLPGAPRIIGKEEMRVKLKDASQDLIIDWRVAIRDNQPQGRVF